MYILIWYSACCGSVPLTAHLPKCEASIQIHGKIFEWDDFLLTIVTVKVIPKHFRERFSLSSNKLSNCLKLPTPHSYSTTPSNIKLRWIVRSLRAQLTADHFTLTKDQLGDSTVLSLLKWHQCANFHADNLSTVYFPFIFSFTYLKEQMNGRMTKW